ncbi:glycosyltransferase [Acetobacteraceae bacterium KSS8]|uniref:Glycosyltransferase n=1 Tax=Endosaccharibacter trunci TaxID=2812733 RepID=A0ABT1W5X7_9PROT|nr:glycosyltransferase [Acetobacteraceae bacterium KSS8]
MPMVPACVPACVAIPVRDEAERIVACLRALSDQHGPAPDHAVLLVNNTRDETMEVVDRLRPALRFPVTAIETCLPPERAHAGGARAEAMRIAAAIAGPDGLLLTTDADGRVQPDWLAATRRALVSGVEVVCGQAAIDPVEALLIPAELHADDASEVAFGTVLDHIHALADPDPFDPWPRHTEHSGASIAVTVRAWQAAGGVPPLPTGEDRAFLRALRRVDRRIRHAPEVRVVVSGRTVGRAVGGMADTMARRMLKQDPLLDGSLEPPFAALRRARARAEFQRLRRSGAPHPDVATLAATLEVDSDALESWLKLPFLGEGWDALEGSSPVLKRRPVERRLLARHHEEAEWIVSTLLRERARAGAARDTEPAD